ncbi:hypothetical protein T484DRAFT_1885441 [Baffinella frigidus]|nr:hypothetical protein T484DRAFT_1885441 [Cryptophyta sp. CCMP2293]
MFAEGVEALLSQTLFYFPTYEEVVLAVLEHGPGGLLKALGLEEAGNGRGLRLRSAKRKAWQAIQDWVETDADSQWRLGNQPQSGAGAGGAGADDELRREMAVAAVQAGIPPAKRAGNVAAVQAGMPPRRLSTDEERLAPDVLRGAGGGNRLLLQLRNTILLRHSRKVAGSSDGMAEGGWFLREEEASAGMEGLDAEAAAVVYRLLVLLGKINPAADLLLPPIDFRPLLYKTYFPTHALPEKSEETSSESGSKPPAERGGGSVLGDGRGAELPADPALSSKRVVVIGAGFAGVAAARRLCRMGVGHVTLLEARDRVGGRTHSLPLAQVTAVEDGACKPGGARDRVGGRTHSLPLAQGSGVEDGEEECKPAAGGDGEEACNSGGGAVDLGGMVVTGTEGNPLVFLSRGVGARMHLLRDSCRIYDQNGKRLRRVT